MDQQYSSTPSRDIQTQGLDALLPVIDLKRGQVVHAVAGIRKSYRPIQSQLVDSFHPGRVAKALLDTVTNSELYVADLDAISGEPPDWNSYASIENAGGSIWIDSGATDANDVQRIVARVSNARVIVGLESLVKLRDLEKLIAILPADRCVFSLDLRDGLPITNDPNGKRMSAESIAAYAVAEGVQSMIVLDLSSVGSSNGGGPTIDLCRNIRSRHPDIEITSGGGVRNMLDVVQFVDAGCNRVLVSTAVHRGEIP